MNNTSNVLDMVSIISVILKKSVDVISDDYIIWYIDNYEIWLEVNQSRISFRIDIENFNIDEVVWYALMGVAKKYAFEIEEFCKN